MIAGLSDGVETGLEVNRHGIEVFSDPQLLYSSRMSELFEVKSSPHELRDGVIDSACWSEVLVQLIQLYSPTLGAVESYNRHASRCSDVRGRKRQNCDGSISVVIANELEAVSAFSATNA